MGFGACQKRYLPGQLQLRGGKNNSHEDDKEEDDIPAAAAQPVGLLGHVC